jgi:serine/threonine protein kinase/Tol biopolymer transport system component
VTERIEEVQRAFTAYIIERELGSGGMATVYLAHDKKHDRKVAIKVLHAELAAVLGAERFLQEIRVTANLQHPHILGLIDSGVVGADAGELRGRPYYVMPYVEGESLRERLDKEQQLPVSDAVRIATEVASALDYAHRHNVIHRDIKPENILLHDGSAIVADFGIALALTQAGGQRMTQSGLSLGTPSYMSPEQAVGERAITARSDIYSLGAVTYEMLSGEPPFTGPTVQAVVSRVMTEEPRPLASQRRNVPAQVEAAVARALQKVPADRFASAHEFADALNNPSFATSSATAARVTTATRRDRRTLYGVSALAAFFLAVAIWGWMRPASSSSVVRYAVALDSLEAMSPAPYWGRLAISHDGSSLAYLGGPRSQVLIRPRNQLHATDVAGSDGAMTPFFSPDGQHVGFFTFRSIAALWLASVNGGPPTSVTDSLVSVAGASWGRDGFIYTDGVGATSLVRVEAKPGAVPQRFTVLDSVRGEVDHTWPDVLPNGKGVVFTDTFVGRSGGQAKSSFAIAVAEIPSGRHRVILNDAMYARYAPSGHLLYVTPSRTLMMVAFDQNSMKITGEPSALLEGMRLGPFGSADLAIADAGTLVYATNSGQQKQELVWVTRDGKAQSIDPDWQAEFGWPSLSPDGSRVAVAIRSIDRTADIWIKQLDRGPSSKLTLEGGGNTYPTWTPDGRSVTYTSDGVGTSEVRTKRADGSAQSLLEAHDARTLYAPHWSTDGKWLVFETSQGEVGSGDILAIRPGVDTKPVPLLATKFIEVSPALSPDGRWLAYTSNETRRQEIYVVPFPNVSAAKWAVSTQGGTRPLWSHRGSELFYVDGTSNLMTVAVKANPTLSFGHPVVLFNVAGFSTDFETNFTLSPDDRRFLMIRQVSNSNPEKLIVVENWFSELKGKPRK